MCMGRSYGLRPCNEPLAKTLQIDVLNSVALQGFSSQVHPPLIDKS